MSLHAASVLVLLAFFPLGLVPWGIALAVERRRKREARPSRSVAIVALLPFAAGTTSAAMASGLFGNRNIGVGLAALLLFVGGTLLLRRSRAAVTTLAVAAAVTAASHAVEVKDQLDSSNRARLALSELDEGTARFCHEPYQAKYDEFYNGCLGVAWAEIGYGGTIALTPWLVGASALVVALACASVVLARRPGAKAERH